MLECPHCLSGATRQSRSWNRVNPIRRVLVVMRCYDCGSKFVSRTSRVAPTAVANSNRLGRS